MAPWHGPLNRAKCAYNEGHMASCGGAARREREGGGKGARRRRLLRSEVFIQASPLFVSRVGAYGILLGPRHALPSGAGSRLPSSGRRGHVATTEYKQDESVDVILDRNEQVIPSGIRLRVILEGKQ